MNELDKYHALRKLRELSRDLLYYKYGANWQAHDKHKGKFFANPDPDELAMLDSIVAFAEK